MFDECRDIKSLGQVSGQFARVAKDVFPRSAAADKYQNPILLEKGITQMSKQWLRVKRTTTVTGLKAMMSRWKVRAAYIRVYKEHKQKV